MTPFEAYPVIAGLLGIEDPGDIDNFVVLAVGKCHSCGERNGFTSLDTVGGMNGIIDLVFAAAMSHPVEG